MYVSNARITPTKRNSNSHVTNISITSPHREGKTKRFAFPNVREATATVYGVLRVSLDTAIILPRTAIFVKSEVTMPKQRLKTRKDGRKRKVVNGKTFYGKSEREIELKILEYQEATAHGRTFAQVADEWWGDTYDTLAYQTVKVYKPALRRALDEFGNKSIKDIQPRDIQRFLKNMAKKDFAQKTVSNQRMIINQIFASAILSGDIIYNPCASSVSPKGLKKEERDPASPEDEARILSTDYAWQLPYIALLTGLRKGEILALQWKDIDFDNNTISVTKSVYHEGDRAYIKAPKTRAGTRTVPLLSLLKERLLMLKGDPEHYIISDTGEKPLTNRRYITEYNHYKAAVGISCTVHQLRHSYATIAVEQEVQPKALQGILGHTSLNMTLGIYAKYRDKMTEQAAEKLNERFTAKHKQ